MPKFRVKLMTITRCKLPEAQWSPDHPPPATFAIKKLDRETTVLSCNFTLEKTLGPIYMTYRTYQLQQNSAKNLMFKLERVSCTNPMTFKIIHMFKVNMTKDCYLHPGNFYYDNFDINKVSWILTKATIVPGRYAYEVEFNDAKGVLSCYDVVCDLVERK